MTKTLTIPHGSMDSLSPGVGFFDSGLGGLAVLREVLRLRPDLSFCYVADQCHAPYGPRSTAAVLALCEGISAALLEGGCEPLVLACHTASAAALYPLRERHACHVFVGMEPAVKPACECTGTGEIGVLATSGTLAGKPYAGVVQRFAGTAKIHTLDCREFVELVESGVMDDSSAGQIVDGIIRPFLADKAIDCLVLACTHYAFLKRLIQQAAGSNVAVIDPCEAVARQVVRVLDSRPTLRRSQIVPGRVFVTTGDGERFSRSVNRLLNIAGVEAIQGVWS